MQLLNTAPLSNAALWAAQFRTFRLDELLRMDSTELAGLITCDADEIRARQEIYADCMQNSRLLPLFDRILSAIDDILALRQKERDSGPDTERALYAVRSLQIYISLIEEISTVATEFVKSLSSTRLRAFFTAFSGIAVSEEFRILREEIATIALKAEGIRSVTLAVNLNAQLQPSEIGLLSINDTYFTSDNLYTRLFGKSGGEGRAAPLLSPDGSEASLEKALYSSLNRSINKLVRKLHSDLLGRCSALVTPLLECRNSLSCIVRSMKFVSYCRGRCGNLCFASVSETGTRYTSAYDPALLQHRTASEIVGNDVAFGNTQPTVLLLTGVNSGGKSIYLRSVVINQLLFQLGLPVAAKAAEVRILHSVFSHLSAGGSDVGGRFAAECAAAKEIIDGADGDSLVLMDEAFSSTNSQEGAAIAYQFIRHMLAKGAYCIFTSHFLELRGYAEELISADKRLGVFHFGTSDGKQTYRLQPGFVEEKNYAYLIAKKYGLEYSAE